MSSTAPIDVVLAFMERINAADVDGLCALMTEDHLFCGWTGESRPGPRSDAQGLGRLLPHVSGLPRVARGDFFARRRGGVVWHGGSDLRGGRKTPEGKPLERAGGVESGRARWLDRGVAGVRGQSGRQKDYGLAQSIIWATRTVYERIRRSQITGERERGEALAGSGAGAAEASAVRGHWICQGGSPSRAAAGLCGSDLWQGQDAGASGGNRAHHAEAQSVAEQCAGDAGGRENVCRREACQPRREISSLYPA